MMFKKSENLKKAVSERWCTDSRCLMYTDDGIVISGSKKGLQNCLSIL